MGPLVAAARQEVGRLGLTQALELVRQHMIVEALRRSGGSKRAAAKLLGIDRAYLRPAWLRGGRTNGRFVKVASQLGRYVTLRKF
jgi:transcriptional regulator with GAF, ATPase, and Fis domain